MAVFIAGENFSLYEKNITDELFESLLDYFSTYKKEHLKELVKLVNNNDHMTILVEQYGVNINDFEFETIWKNKDKSHMVSSLIKYNYKHIVDFVINNVVVEYSKAYSEYNKDNNNVIPQTLIHAIHEVINNKEIFECVCKQSNPLSLVPVFNERNQDISPFVDIYYTKGKGFPFVSKEELLKELIKNQGIDKVIEWCINTKRLSKINILNLVKSELVSEDVLNILYYDKEQKAPYPVYELLFSEIPFIKLLSDKSDEKKVNPIIDFSLMTERSINTIFEMSLRDYRYAYYVYNYLPDDKLLLKNKEGQTILHYVANNIHSLGHLLKIFKKRGLDINLPDDKGKTFAAHIRIADIIFSLVENNKIFDIHAPEYEKIKSDILSRSEGQEDFGWFHVKKIISQKEKELLTDIIEENDKKVSNKVRI